MPPDMNFIPITNSPYEPLLQEIKAMSDRLIAQVGEMTEGRLCQ